MEADIREFIDKAQIREAIQAYCRAVDRGDADLLRSVYHEDAREEHGIYNGSADGYREYVMGFVDKAGVSAHHITTCNIRLDGNSAASEAYFIAYHCDIPKPEGGLTDLVLGGRYLDAFERRSGSAWKIARRRVLYDWNHVQSFAARWDGPFFELWRPRGATGPTDESFEFFRQRAPRGASK